MLTYLVIWFLVSIPVGLVLGKAIAFGMGE